MKKILDISEAMFNFCDNTDYFNSLDQKQKQEYLELYSIYLDLLIQYLMNKINLKKYEEIIEQDHIGFPRLPIKKLDFYQYLNSGYLNYFYIRNNLHVERLSTNEIQYLRSKLENPILDETAIDFIELSFKKVVFENYDSLIDQKTNYGPNNMEFMRSDRSLIIGVRYDDYYMSADETEQQWIEKNKYRQQFLYTLALLMEKEITKKSGIQTHVIKYNDYSVKKKITK